MNRSELRHMLFEEAEELGIEISLGMKATALLGLEFMSNDQVDAIGSVIDEGMKALRNRDYEEVGRIMRLVGVPDDQADKVVEYARAADRDPA